MRERERERERERVGWGGGGGELWPMFSFTVSFVSVRPTFVTDSHRNCVNSEWDYCVPS